MPPDIEPMLATPGIPANLSGWVAEPKLDGWRARMLVDHDGLAVRTRSGGDLTASVPGLDGLIGSGLRMVLDGELVVGSGRLSAFHKLGPAFARRRPEPGWRVVFVAFDLLWHDGQLLTGRPYTERRATLGHLGLVDFGLATIPEYEWDDAAALVVACAAHGVDGIVLKEPASCYTPGERTALWRKATARELPCPKPPAGGAPNGQPCP